MGPIILDTLTAHQYLLFWDFIYPLRWKYASLLTRTIVESIYPACSPWRHQFKIFSLVSWSVSNSLLTPVIYGSKWNGFVSLHADDADTPISCAIQANDFLEDVYNLAPISLSFLNICLLMFSHCLERSLSHENFLRNCKVVPFGTGSPEIFVWIYDDTTLIFDMFITYSTAYCHFGILLDTWHVCVHACVHAPTRMCVCRSTEYIHIHTHAWICACAHMCVHMHMCL